MFNLRDRVRKIGKTEIWTIEQVRGVEPCYCIQFGADFATREWARESELELVAKWENPDGGPGMALTEPIM
jgi:hypothetical protein